MNKHPLPMPNSISFDQLEALPIHIYYKDKNGAYMWCNQNQLKTLGFTSLDDIVGKTDLDICERDVADRIKENDLSIMETGQPKSFEEYGKFGSIRFCLSHKTPFIDLKTRKILGVAGMSLNLTKQKELEALLERKTHELIVALEIRERLLNNISHEIRTPLQSIIGISESLTAYWESISDKERKEYVKSLANSGDRLMNLLSNFMDLSKLKKGNLSFDFQHHDIKISIIEIITEFYGITHPIDLTMSSSVDTFILYDAWRIKQVVRNLIANSVKHGGKNKLIQITLSTTSRSGNKFFLVSIKDEGVGLAENALEAIFEPFYESSKTRRNSGGTGIGLAICKDIITAHGGEIWAENNTNQAGATFYFTLPYEKRHEKVYTFRMTVPS